MSHHDIALNIGISDVRLYRWMGRTTSASGMDVDSYAEPVALHDAIANSMTAVQAVRNGLDVQGRYAIVRSSERIDGPAVGRNPDRIQWHGRMWVVVAVTYHHLLCYWRVIIQEIQSGDGV